MLVEKRHREVYELAGWVVTEILRDDKYIMEKPKVLPSLPGVSEPPLPISDLIEHFR